MTMTGNQNIFLLVYLIAAVLDLTLNFLLVPKMGMVGAAIASSISVAVLNLIMYMIVWKKLRVKASIF